MPKFRLERSARSRPFWWPISATVRPSSLPTPVAVAVQLEPVVEHPPDVVEGVGALLVPRELDLVPDLLVGRLGLDPVELPLQALELTGEASAAQEVEPTQLAQPVPEPDLCIPGHPNPFLRRLRTAAAAARASAAARVAPRSRRRGRSGGWTRRGRSRPAASRAWSGRRRAGRRTTSARPARR